METQKWWDELPHLSLALQVFLGGSMKVAYESKVAATKEPAAPMNLHVLSLLEDIDDLEPLVDGYQIRDLVTQPANEYLRWVRGVQQLVVWDGVDRALQVRRVHKRVSNAVGLAPMWQRRAALCPDCSLPTLGQWTGSDLVQCGNEDCNLCMSLTDYENHCIENSR